MGVRLHFCAPSFEPRSPESQLLQDGFAVRLLFFDQLGEERQCPLSRLIPHGAKGFPASMPLVDAQEDLLQFGDPRFKKCLGVGPRWALFPLMMVSRFCFVYVVFCFVAILVMAIYLRDANSHMFYMSRTYRVEHNRLKQQLRIRQLQLENKTHPGAVVQRLETNQASAP